MGDTATAQEMQSRQELEGRGCPLEPQRERGPETPRSQPPASSEGAFLFYQLPRGPALLAPDHSPPRRAGSHSRLGEPCLPGSGCAEWEGGR